MKILLDTWEYLKVTRQLRYLPHLVAVLVLLAIALFPQLREMEAVGVEGLHTLGPYLPVLFVGVYALGTTAFLPASPFDIAAGAVFGFAVGVLWIQLAATLAAALGFLLGRHTLSGLVRFLERRNPRVRALDDAVLECGGRIVLLTRISPLFHFGFLNVYYGSTRIPFRAYLPASFIGMLPGTLVNAYAGSIAADLARGDDSVALSTLHWPMKIAGFAATIIVTIIITREARRRLQVRLDEAAQNQQSSSKIGG